MKKLTKIVQMQWVLLAATVVLLPAARAEKHEVMTMQEVLPYVNNKTLVVFDIDNTLAESSETIGSVQWQENEIERAKEEGIPSDKALDRSVRRFTAVNFATRLRPVERDTTAIVNKMANQGAYIMALTARPADLHARTTRLLKDIGLNMGKANPLSGRYTKFVNEQAQYSSGILAVGPTNDKGEMLKWIMSQPGFEPFERIVFVDDKLKYVDSVERAFGAGHFELHTFRYGAADARVAAFDKNLARVQTDYFLEFGQILPDSIAKQLLNK